MQHFPKVEVLDESITSLDLAKYHINFLIRLLQESHTNTSPFHQ